MNVQREIIQVMDVKLDLNPALFIVGILPDNMTDRDIHLLLRILLLITKIEISFLV